MQVTGRGSNVNFTIDDRAPFEAVIAGVEECLVKNRHLFSKGNITVNVGRRILAREQLTQIKRVLEAESGLTVAQFWCSPEILEETLSNAGPEQPPEALDKDTPIKSQGLPENQPESEIPPDQLGLARSDLDRSEEPDEARDSPGQTLRWPTPGLPAIPKPVSSIPPFAEKGGTVETKGEPLPAEDSQYAGSQFSPEAEACDDPQALAEPVAQIAPEGAGDLIPEPSIEPIIEPGLLELALMGLEQSIAAGGLESGQDGSTASLESRPESLSPESLSPEAHSPEAHPGEAGLRTDASTNTGVGTSINSHQEIGGLNRQNEALLIKTTCRSGEVVRYPGDVVILADVNPGAEIIADGDILVWGSLRGLAHAGAGGDIQATIIALNLESPRIQIGPYNGMAPKAKKRNKSDRTGPTLAFVRRQHIFVAPFKGRFAGYSGGILYDG